MFVTRNNLRNTKIEKVGNQRMNGGAKKMKTTNCFQQKTKKCENVCQTIVGIDRHFKTIQINNISFKKLMH
jgi:hypothetical protein